MYRLALTRPSQSTLLLVTIIFYYISTLLNGSQLNIIALTTLFWVAFTLPSNTKEAWIFILYLLGLLSATSANVIIEHLSPYLIEIREHAMPTGGAARNSLLTAFFLCSAFIFFRFFAKALPKDLKKSRKIEKAGVKTLVFLGFAFLAYMAFVIARHGSPLTMGIDRFTYWANIAPPGYRYITSLIPTFAFIVSYSRETGTLRSSFATSWLLLAASLLILGGEKFSGLIITAFFYFLPYFCLSNIKLSARAITLGTTLLALAVSVILLNYYFIFGNDYLEIFASRIALQGQMLFAVDRLATTTPISTDSIIGNFISSGKTAGDSGIKYLMYLIAPLDLVERHISNGVTFTAPFPANLNYFFGFYLSPIAAVFLGLIVGLSGSALYISLKERAFFLSLISLKTFFFLYIAVMMGEVHMIFDWKMAIYATITSSLFIISRKQSKNEHRSHRTACRV